MSLLKLLGVSALGVSALMACVTQTASAEEKAIFNFAQGYATVAHAVFEDAYVSAKNLNKAINQLIETPSELHLMQAQQVHEEAGFLHDGRARTIEEAIVWHGGEAKKSKSQFLNLQKEERQAVLAFLDSL